MSTPWPHSIRAVAFDLDGLIFNTEELYVEVGQTILQRHGKQLTRELVNAMMGLPNLKALQVMIDWHQLDATPHQLLDETKQMFTTMLPTRLKPMPGLLELLDFLESLSIPKAIATSSTRPLVEMKLNTARLGGRFSFWVTSDDVTHGKPSPDIYLKATDQFGISSHEMLVLEDSQVGCRAAVAAGACTVAVPGEHSQDHDFSGVAFVANTLGDARIFELLGQ
jgi:pseudouridine-5'-monophosphatase